jgi:nitroreductase
MSNNILNIKDKIKKAHLIGQHCQRNYDLTKVMPQEDIDLIIHAATQCPSKQNLDYYSIIAVQNRNIIEEIYNNTTTAAGRKNSQVLGQLLLIFTTNNQKVSYSDRNAESRSIHDLGNLYNNTSDQLNKNFKNDRHQAVGVAAGYVNLTASLLGYRSGCNKCFDIEVVKNLLNLDNEEILLMMGIGINDINRNRREEHFDNFLVETHKKIPIKVTHI